MEAEPAAETLCC